MKLPRKGEFLTITGPSGETATIRRCSSGKDWMMVKVGFLRARFGNAAEIKQDITSFQETGTLPRSSGQGWA